MIKVYYYYYINDIHLHKQFDNEHGSSIIKHLNNHMMI